MTLTSHFSVAEAEHSDTAERLGIFNTMNEQQTHNAQRMAIELERIRATVFLNQPIKIHSWFRSAVLNNVVGGSKGSWHLAACAVDFDPPPGMSHDECQHKIAAIPGLNFDLILEEGTAKPESEGGSRWIHFQIGRPGELVRHLVRDAEVDQLGGTITRTLPG